MALSSNLDGRRDQSQGALSNLIQEKGLVNFVRVHRSPGELTQADEALVGQEPILSFLLSNERIPVPRDPKVNRPAADMSARARKLQG
jgi:hypothetical protein